MKRKGVMASLESLVAASIFLVFVVSIVPGLTQNDSNEFEPLKKEIYETLSSYDKEGGLRQAALNQNATDIRKRVEKVLGNDIGFSVGFLYLNYSRGEFSVGDQQTRQFEINKTLSSSEYLKVKIMNLSSPELLVNSIKVWESSKDYDKHIKKLSISGQTSSGLNNFTVRTNTPGEVEYEIGNHYYDQESKVPDIKHVFSQSYHVSGLNETLRPTELRIIAWRR